MRVFLLIVALLGLVWLAGQSIEESREKRAVDRVADVKRVEQKYGIKIADEFAPWRVKCLNGWVVYDGFDDNITYLKGETFEPIPCDMSKE